VTVVTEKLTQSRQLDLTGVASLDALRDRIIDEFGHLL
jgi:hypothetical protein